LKEGNLLEQYQEFCKEVFKIDGYMLERKRMLKIFKFWGDVSKIPVEENSIVYRTHLRSIPETKSLAASWFYPCSCKKQSC
jgi:hypothetical protein